MIAVPLSETDALQIAIALSVDFGHHASRSNVPKHREVKSFKQYTGMLIPALICSMSYVFSLGLTGVCSELIWIFSFVNGWMPRRRSYDHHSTKERRQRTAAKNINLGALYSFFLSKSAVEKFSFIKFWLHETSPSNRFFSFPKLCIPSTIKILLCSGTRNEFCVF